MYEATLNRFPIFGTIINPQQFHASSETTRLYALPSVEQMREALIIKKKKDQTANSLNIRELTI